VVNLSETSKEATALLRIDWTVKGFSEERPVLLELPKYRSAHEQE